MTTDAAVGGAIRQKAQTTATLSPLTEAQAGLWYAQRLDPANPIFNTAQYVDITGPLDVAAFREAVNEAMREADALAVRVIDSADGPQQIVDENRRASLVVVDLRGEPEPMRAAEVRMQADLTRPLDPECDALAAQVLFVLADERHVWYQRVHHLVIDGYGTVLLTARICDLYSSRSRTTLGGGSSPSASTSSSLTSSSLTASALTASSRPPGSSVPSSLTSSALAPSKLTSSTPTPRTPSTQPFGAFPDVLDADAQYRTSSRRLDDRTWWQTELAGAPPVVGLAVGQPVTAHSYLRSGFDLAEGTAKALHDTGEAADVPWPDIVTALVGAYVARHVGAAGHDGGGAAGIRDVGGARDVVGVLGMPATLAAREASGWTASTQRVDGGGTEAGDTGGAGYTARGADARVEVTLGVAVMERLGTPAARVPAMVMNVLPVRVPIDEDQPIAEWFLRVSNRLRHARRRGRYRSEQLRRDLGLLGAERRLHGPLVNVLPFDEQPRIAGANAKLHVLATGPVDDLTVTIRADSRSAHMRAELDGNPRLYDQLALDAHASRLAAFIARALGSTRLADVPTLTPAEHDRWVVEVNDTAHPVEQTTLTALIARSAATTPDAPALVFGQRELSYADLQDLSGHLAATLIDRGVRGGDIVGVVLPRSIELVATLYAILRIGAAYLPLDHDQPEARLAQMLTLARPRCVVTTAAAASRLPAGTNKVLFDELLAESRPGGAAAVAAAIDASAPTPGDAVYVIFTSGSTGEPKGVVTEHHAIVNRLEWMRTHYQVGAADRILQKTPSTFDVSVWEFFLPLIAGATLVIAPPDMHKDPLELAKLIRAQRVTLVHFVPSMLAEFLSEPAAAQTSMRAVFCSGEALPAALRDQFHATLHAELHNLYGPTEAAVDVTWWLASADDRSDLVPIGHPVWNTRLYILDDRLRPVPPGVPGHLFIGGVQLAREYLGRPDLTHERFIDDPFGAVGDRLYRTGDLARWRADGVVEFLGRSDHQVKIRGQRIELGEIEAAIMATGRIARAVVIAREDMPGDVRLVAYVEPVAPTRDADEGEGEDEGEATTLLASEVAARLPAVMMPSAFVRIDEWPVTPNGKLDRRQLPAPSRQRDTGAGRAPATPTEQRVAALFAEVLRLDASRAVTPASTTSAANAVTSAARPPSATQATNATKETHAINAVGTIGADADFFALGGHSLLATQLVRRLREEWAREIGLGAIFAHPTVARLAAHLDGVSRETGDGFEVLLPLRTRPLSTIGSSSRISRPDDAAALACVHPAGGIAWCYGHLARALEPPRDVYGLQARGLRSGTRPPADLNALAADYVAVLRQAQPKGPYHLVGWSVGGIIAHAMAVQLEAAGQRVGVLAALDAYPSDRWRSATDPDEAAALRALLLMAGEDPDGLGAGVNASASPRAGTSAPPDAVVKARKAAEGLTRHNVIETLRRGQHPLGMLSDDTLSGVLRVVEHNNRLVRRHVHTPCAARMIHFKAALDQSAATTSADEWRPYVGALYRIDVPFIHAHMTGAEASRLIAPILSEHMRS
jgi:enterobactin synthetase component F